MGINISAKGVKLWVNEHQGKNGGTFNSYAVSVSRKGADGNYRNKSVRVVLGKDIVVPQGVFNGCTVDFEGFLSLDAYTDKNGAEQLNISIFATSMTFSGVAEPSEPTIDTFAEVEQDIPF